MKIRNSTFYILNSQFDCLGGGFTWTNSCCSISSSGNSFTYSCDENCHCTGCCALGCYAYEGFSLPASGGACGCSAESGPDIGGTNEPPTQASVCVAFSQKVLFYESEFVNSLGVSVPEYSETNITLSCSVYGGSMGGEFSLVLENFDKLTWVGGDSLPSSVMSIGPGESHSWSVTYEFASHSDSEGDVRATGAFIENLSGKTLDSGDTMTVVMLTTAATETWPTNQCRMTFGVGEDVRIYTSPNIDNVASASLGTCSNGLMYIRYHAPHQGGDDQITITANGCSHTLEYSILEPTGYSVINIKSNLFAQAGMSGGFDMDFVCRLLSRRVSFRNVELIELPRVATNAVGYYAQPAKTNLLDHGLNGAASWDRVRMGNIVLDHTRMGLNDPPWLEGGSFTWPIPNAWRVGGDFGVTNVFCNTDQRFELDADGTARMEKFGNVGERTTNGGYRSWRRN